MSFPQATIYKTHPYSLYEHPLENLSELRTLQKTVCLKNNIIPDEIWLKGTDPDEEIDYELMTLIILLISMTCKRSIKKNSSR